MIIEIYRTYHPDIGFNLCSIFHRSILELQFMWFKCSPKSSRTPVHHRWTELSEYCVINSINIWPYKQVGRTSMLVKLLGNVTHCYDAFRSVGRSLGPNSDVLNSPTGRHVCCCCCCSVWFCFHFLRNLGYNLKRRTRQLLMNLWVIRWLASQQLLYKFCKLRSDFIKKSMWCCPPRPAQLRHADEIPPRKKIQKKVL